MKATILHNAAAQLSSHAGIIIAQICYAAAVARLLDVYSFGIFSFALGVAQIALLSSDLGLNLLLVRRWAAGGREEFGEILGLKAALSALAGIVLAVSGWGFLADPVAARTLAAFAAGMAVHSVSLSFSMAFQASGRLYMAAFLALLLALLQLLFGLGVLAAGWGVAGLGWAYLGAALCVLVLAAFLLRRTDPGLAFRMRWGRWPLLLRQSLPMGMGSVLNSVAARIDVALLLAMSGAVEVGLYSAAYRITGSLANVPVAFCSAVLPLLARSRWGGAEMGQLLERTLALVVAASGGILLLFALAGPQVLELLFGAAFRSSHDLLALLLWAALPAFVNSVLLHAAVSQRETARGYALAAACGASGNILLNLWWIPLWQGRGAALATVATEYLVAACYLAGLRRVLPRPGPRLWRLLLLAAPAPAAALLPLGGWAPALAAVVLYGLLVWAVGGLGREDWSFWRSRTGGDSPAA